MIILYHQHWVPPQKATRPTDRGSCPRRRMDVGTVAITAVQAAS
jgi:hypothetical protein